MGGRQRPVLAGWAASLVFRVLICPVILGILSFCDKVVIGMSMAADTQAATIAWRKSSFSVTEGACVEVGSAVGSIVVRDSAAPASLTLRWSSQAWCAFAAAIRAHALDASLGHTLVR